MWVSKAATGALVALALLPPSATLWETSRPTITDVAVIPIYLDNSTYRISLQGTINKNCSVENGSARMVRKPEGGIDLGEWEFDLRRGVHAVSLDIRLLCRKERRIAETLGPWPIMAKEEK